jgi:hypothetical protein
MMQKARAAGLLKYKEVNCILNGCIIMSIGDRENHTASSQYEAGDLHIPPRYRIRRFLEFQLKIASEISLKAARKLIDPDYTPESLERLERWETQSPEDFHAKVLPNRTEHGLDNSPAQLWFLHMGLGSYFGEVLVRNLGGRWRYPSRFLVIMAILFSQPDMVYRHWYVVVGKQKIPVIELARRRAIMGAKESLVEVYREIANGEYRPRK